MISPIEQSNIIHRINDLNGFEFGEFTSASLIEGNLKINLAEVMDDDVCLRLKLATYIVSELEKYRINTVVATGGAINLAKDVAALADFDFIAINSMRNQRGVKNFSIDEDSRVHANKYRSKLAYIEDVSSTWGTVKRSLADADIKEPEVAVSAWRRGRPAPLEISAGKIALLSALNNYRPPYEERLSFPVRGVIERPIPLHIDSRANLEYWLPEVQDEDRGI